MYKPSNDGISVLGEAGKDFPNQSCNFVKVVICSLDADTTVALQIEEASALVLVDDTDDLCLLIHHFDTSQKQHNSYIKNMSRRNENNERVCYRIHDVIDNLDRVIVNFILFAHAFTCSDSMSAIHNIRKQTFFSKLPASDNLRRIA